MFGLLLHREKSGGKPPMCLPVWPGWCAYKFLSNICSSSFFTIFLLQLLGKEFIGNPCVGLLVRKEVDKDAWYSLLRRWMLSWSITAPILPYLCAWRKSDSPCLCQDFEKPVYSKPRCLPALRGYCAKANSTHQYPASPELTVSMKISVRVLLTVLTVDYQLCWLR
jgi:hypothetical protein